MKVLSIVGNRPQFIKSAPLSLALRAAGIDEVVVHTGQHYDRELSQVFFEELGLAEPAYRLDLRTADPVAMRPGIVGALERERPDWAVVYGDTNSTLAGAEAARSLGVPVAHVEAGLRSGDWTMPEERNRVAVDRIARLLFCPDERSSEQLASERVAGGREVVGDVMYDATLRLAPIARRRSGIVGHLGVTPGEYVVATIHREANVEHVRLERIVSGLARVDRDVVFPAHPRTMQALIDARIDVPPDIDLVKPLGYLDMAALVADAHALVTDSGGLQKEAYWLGVPCITARPSTEWVDTVRAGANVLVDADPDLLVEAVRRAELPADLPELYGDGRASERIAAALTSSLSPG